MPKIELLELSCRDPKAQCEFYCSILGMHHFGNFTVGYDNAAEAKIRFVSVEQPYRPKSNDLYWKIALAVPNIDLACQQLQKNGVDVGAPHQFQDVGYLAHFTDPEGYTIELIDHWFEGHRPKLPVNSDLFGCGAHFNLLTLRATEIGPIQKLCRDIGMKPLAIQIVKGRGFTLHFFAFTSEQPPYPDLHAVENRPWLYQRPYTVLEIQHVSDLGMASQSLSDGTGYRNALLSGLTEPIQPNGLKLGTYPSP